MEIKGLSEDKIKKISECKGEDKKTLEYRLKCYETFKKLGLPNFGPSLSIDFDNIKYYESSSDNLTDDWKDINLNTKKELDSLGVISSEKYLDGIGVQYQSEVIYHNMLKELEEKNVIFTSIETAMKEFKPVL